MGIMSIVAYAKSDKQDSFITKLEELNIKIEQHLDNRFILLLDNEDEKAFENSLRILNSLDEVHSLSYASYYSEDCI